MRATCRRIEIVVFGHATRLLCKMDRDTTAAEREAELLAKIEHLEKENARYAKIIDKYIE